MWIGGRYGRLPPPNIPRIPWTTGHGDANYERHRCGSEDPECNESAFSQSLQTRRHPMTGVETELVHRCSMKGRE